MVRCFCCKAEAASVSEAIDLGWSPSFFADDEEVSEPICLGCFYYCLVFNPEFGDWEMRDYLVDKFGLRQSDPLPRHVEWGVVEAVSDCGIQAVADISCDLPALGDPCPACIVEYYLISKDLLERIEVVLSNDEHADEHDEMIMDIRTILGHATMMIGDDPHPPTDLVDEDLACPHCSERRSGALEFSNDGTEITCMSCHHKYKTLTFPDNSSSNRIDTFID